MSTPCPPAPGRLARVRAPNAPRPEPSHIFDRTGIPSAPDASSSSHPAAMSSPPARATPPAQPSTSLLSVKELHVAVPQPAHLRVRRGVPLRGRQSSQPLPFFPPTRRQAGPEATRQLAAATGRRSGVHSGPTKIRAIRGPAAYSLAA